MRTQLTEDVLTYQRLLDAADESLKQKKESLYRHIVQECSLIIYRYPVRVRLLKEEEASELLISVFPRLPRIIATFSYTGIAFENYMRKVAYMQANSFLQRKRMKERHIVCDAHDPEELERLVCSSSPSCFPDSVREAITSDITVELETDFDWTDESPVALNIKGRMEKSDRFRRRILQLILLCSECLTASHISFLAKFLAIDETALATLVTQAMELSRQRHQITIHMQQIRDYHYSEKQFLERELQMLKSFNADPLYMERVEKRLTKELQFFSDRCKEAQNRPLAVTHAIVAKLTKVPKGTVDSGMQALRKYIEHIVDDIT